MTLARWEHYSHGADIGVRGLGSSAEEAFEQAALALTAVVADISSVRPLETIQVHCEAPDLDLLLVTWLNKVIYEMAVRSMLFERFKVVLSGNAMTGTMTGEAVDPERHQLAVEAKGATVTDLKVECDSSGQWLAQCIVDV